jgi:conjugative transfer signal peptidase TraF
MSVRPATIAAMFGGAVLIALPAWIGHRPQFIWNASASVPIGFYRVEPYGRIGVADIAIVMPPKPLAEFMARRGYLSKNVPLLKRVLALGGQTVCRRRTAIILGGVTYGHAREYDSRGRALPLWQGCRVIPGDEVFLMNWDATDSFDGRYFGPLPLTSIIGRAVPLWTCDDTFSAPIASDDPVPGGLAKARSPLFNAHERSTAMALIGTFTRNDDGFFGNITTLALDAKLAILPAEKSDAENAPDHRVFCEGMEVGAAWDRSGDKAGAYLSVSIDDPSFTQPLRANLFQSDAEKGAWRLYWSRPSKSNQRG